MAQRSTVTPGPWPERDDEDAPPTHVSGPAAGPIPVVSMSSLTFDELVDELGAQSEENVRLRAALAVRPAVSLATGVLMFRYGIAEEQALDLLSRWSDQLDMGLREFACAVLEIVARDPESLEVELLRAAPEDAYCRPQLRRWGRRP
jgi:hypothetical protein